MHSGILFYSVIVSGVSVELVVSVVLITEDTSEDTSTTSLSSVGAGVVSSGITGVSGVVDTSVIVSASVTSEVVSLGTSLPDEVSTIHSSVITSAGGTTVSVGVSGVSAGGDTVSVGVSGVSAGGTTVSVGVVSVCCRYTSRPVDRAIQSNCVSDDTFSCV